jgi:DNA-directed RNA polymerase subunit RPC12/RpoP
LSDLQTYYCGICNQQVRLVRNKEDDLIAVRCEYCGYLFDYEPAPKNMYFKVIIAGSRKFNDYKKLSYYCDRTVESLREDDRPIEIVSGAAKGADRLGERYARERGYKIKSFPAPWEEIDDKPPKEIATRLGRKYWVRAGHFRNEKMARYADALILFWDGKSKGSKNMLQIAKHYNLTIDIFEI